MKLYSSALCFGLLVVMVCQDRYRAPLVVSDFCRQTAYAVAKIESLSREQVKALPAQQRRANLSLVLKHQKSCRGKRNPG